MTKPGRAKPGAMTKPGRSQKVSVYRGHNPAGETAISAPTKSEPAATVLIVAEDETETVKMELGFQEEILVFAHSDAIKAIQRISRDRPRLVMLARAFADTSRGAALVHTMQDRSHPGQHPDPRDLASRRLWTPSPPDRTECGIGGCTARRGAPLRSPWLACGAPIQAAIGLRAAGCWKSGHGRRAFRDWRSSGGVDCVATEPAGPSRDGNGAGRGSLFRASRLGHV